MILHLYKGYLFGKILFNLSSKNNTAIYLENVKKQQHYFTAKPMEAVCWLPTDSDDPSCCWQHKSCYSNILLVCWSWMLVLLEGCGSFLGVSCRQSRVFSDESCQLQQQKHRWKEGTVSYRTVRSESPRVSGLVGHRT